MEKPRSLMASGGRWVLRSALIIGLASVATTVVYFTPVPGQFQLFSVLAACVVKRVAWMLKRRLKMLRHEIDFLSVCVLCCWHTNDAVRTMYI
jgi:hypothetical protein